MVGMKSVEKRRVKTTPDRKKNLTAFRFAMFLRKDIYQTMNGQYKRMITCCPLVQNRLSPPGWIHISMAQNAQRRVLAIPNRRKLLSNFERSSMRLHIKTSFKEG